MSVISLRRESSKSKLSLSGVFGDLLSREGWIGMSRSSREDLCLY